MAKKIIREDLAIVAEAYTQAGKGEHFKKNILPKIKTQEDLEDLVKTSFGNPETRTQFDGALSQNEFVDQFYNIYRQRVLTLLAGEIPYINVWLKEAPFSGSQGYISQNIKSGKDFTFTFSEGTFNPDRRPAYLQVISTSIERQYADEISINIIGRAASKEGGLNKYINDRISMLGEDFIAEIRAVIIAAMDTPVGKTLTITIPTELQGVLQKEQRARYIMEAVIAELKYMSDNSDEYSDNGFITRTPAKEIVGLISREGSAEMSVQAFGMLRNKDIMGDINLSKMIDVPTTEMTTGFYMKFMTPDKIHYSNSVQVSGIDVINANMKAIYTKTVFTEIDIIDTEPCLTVNVVDAVEGVKVTKAATTKVEKDLAKRTKNAKANRQKFYKKIKALYRTSQLKDKTLTITEAPVDGTVVEESEVKQD